MPAVTGGGREMVWSELSKLGFLRRVGSKFYNTHLLKTRTARHFILVLLLFIRHKMWKRIDGKDKD